MRMEGRKKQDHNYGERIPVAQARHDHWSWEPIAQACILEI